MREYIRIMDDVLGSNNPELSAALLHWEQLRREEEERRKEEEEEQKKKEEEEERRRYEDMRKKRQEEWARNVRKGVKRL